MKTGIVAAVLISTVIWLTSSSAFAACCYEGCCDCSCVGLKAEKKANRVAAAAHRHLGGNLQSFTIDASDKKASSGSWTCWMQAEVAVCNRK
ncbi:MAG: hypothetical protein WAK63_09800 [Xanthobacteraceae bacterium]